MTETATAPETGRRFFKSLTGRLLLAAAIWSSASLLIGGYVLSFAFRSYIQMDMDERMGVLMDTMVGASEISTDGVLRFSRPLFDQRFVTPYSGMYWQVSEEGRPAFRSRSLWDHELEADLSSRRFALTFTEKEGPEGQVLRVLEQDVILPEADRIFRYMVAEDTAEITDAIKRFDGLLLVALTTIFVMFSLALITQVRYGLRPLRSIGRKLSAIRSGKEARLGEDWPEDLKPLAEEIDGLLEQNEKLVDRARTHVGNLAHALKTPLSVLRNEIQNPTGDQRLYEKQLRAMEDHINHHLKRARIAGGGSGKGLAVYDRLQKLERAIAIMYKDKNLIIDMTCPSSLKFDGEKEDFDEIVGNIMENAGKFAVSRIEVRVTPLPEKRNRAFFELRVDDDGKGVPDDALETLFERGKRLDEHVPGTGLGLAIVRDIVDMYGGQSRLEHSPLGGLSVVLILPEKRKNQII